MARPNRATQEKRNRERSRKERQQEKEEQRNIRKEARADKISGAPDGVDPDLIGIYPGPQPKRDEF